MQFHVSGIQKARNILVSLGVVLYAFRCNQNAYNRMPSYDVRKLLDYYYSC